MNLPFYIAKRYLFAKKSHNAINFISAISVCGVSVGTTALVVILSVFNGFDSLIKSLFNSFDPDLKITLTEGKTFSIENIAFEKIKNHEGVLYLSEVIEENALLRYGENEHIATIKGVSDEFIKMSGIDSMIVNGDFILKHNNNNFAVIGQGVAIYLSVGLNFSTPIKIYVPKRTKNVSFNPETAFNKKNIFPSGIFAIEQNFDSKYVIIPIEFARKLLDYTTEVSALELKINPEFDQKEVKKEIQNILGSEYVVKNRYEQNELFYKIMKSEKWAIFFILTFILIVASFNIIGSLTMLIIEKKEDIFTLQSLGANFKLIRNIFLYEGWMISIIGALAGLFLGTIICKIQLEYELIKLRGSGSFIIDAYPVDMHFTDLVSVFLTVLFIGFLAAWYPARYISKKYLRFNKQI